MRKREPKEHDHVIMAVMCFISLLLASRAFFLIGYEQALSDAAQSEWWCECSESTNASP